MQQYYQHVLKTVVQPSKDDPIHQCRDIDLGSLGSKYDEYFQLADKKLHVFPFKDVKACWFRLYTDMSIIRAIKLIPENSTQCGGVNRTDWLDEFVSILDMALIMAGALGREEMIHNLLAEFRSDFLSKKRPSSGADNHADDDNHDVAALLPQEEYSIPKIRHPVHQIRDPAWLDFREYIHKQAQPAVLRNILDDWPAMKQWNKIDYWRDLTLQGRRLVPIELGRSYVDESWGQEIMPFKSFLDRHILNHESTNKTGYLAQHDLFRQIRGLRADAPVPDYCYLDTPPMKQKSTNSNNENQSTASNGVPNILGCKAYVENSHPTSVIQDVKATVLPHTNEKDADASDGVDSEDDKDDDNIHTNIWFGPPWTISPLHHDPYHNILCQVVGKKYIRLFSPDYSSQLFPRSNAEPAPHLQKEENDMSYRGDKRAASTSTATADSEAKTTIDMSNTSTVDIAAMQLSPDEDWDEVYPGISTVPYQEVILEAGQALYIPVGWWHFVRSCSVGISVSFWWN